MSKLVFWFNDIGSPQFKFKPRHKHLWISCLDQCSHGAIVYIYWTSCHFKLFYFNDHLIREMKRSLPKRGIAKMYEVQGVRNIESETRNMEHRLPDKEQGAMNTESQTRNKEPWTQNSRQGTGTWNTESQTRNMEHWIPDKEHRIPDNEQGAMSTDSQTRNRNMEHWIPDREQEAKNRQQQTRHNESSYLTDLCPVH